MAIAERLAKVGEEIQHVENDLRERRRLLTAFWRHLGPGFSISVLARKSQKAYNIKHRCFASLIRLTRQVRD